ncbi:MAG TPA: M48 family metalloprotease [Anaerolineales bacterium]|nr:M48 family metalloprotease [Anaerolineales bacterium]
MGRLIFSSLFTLAVLMSLVFGVVMAVMLFTDTINIWLAIGLTIIFNVIAWLVGPFFTDWLNRVFYKTKFISPEDLAKEHPEISEIIQKVSSEYNFHFPKFGVIADKNPTAFTYGSGRFNARIVVTEGLFHFLSAKEAQAVVAHELGHIVNRDFIVMMVASTLVQILFELYAVLIRAQGKRSGNLKIIALVSYGLYVFGIYLLLFLSRTREYLADAFSARYTSPQTLSDALIKVAYGIVAAGDDDSSKRLLASTRHLGIVDVVNAKYYGVTSYVAQNDSKVLAEVMVFDRVSPWAKIAELNSTHPLTGKRIGHLGDLAKEMGKKFSFDIDGAVERMKIDRSRLYADFALGFLVSLLPWILGLGVFLFVSIPGTLAAFGIGMLLQLAYRYPFGTPQPTTVLEEMRNPYASPARGKPVELSGKVIGRGVPGYIFGEDMMYQDKTGLIFLNYTSALGFLGNWFFALKKLKTLFEVPSTVKGWFFRGIGSMIMLRTLTTEKEKIRSYPILWSLLIPLILVALSVLLALFLA